MPYRLSHSGLVLSFLRNSDRAQNVAVQPGTTAAQAEIQTFKNIYFLNCRQAPNWLSRASLTAATNATEAKATAPVDGLYLPIPSLYLVFGSKTDTL